MIVSAANFAEKLGEKETSKGFKNMSATLNHEVDRLQSLQKYNNHIRSEEIELAIEEKSKLEKLINGATVRMDAIQLIQKGSF
jgi:ATP-dependent helicase HepA